MALKKILPTAVVFVGLALLFLVQGSHALGSEESSALELEQASGEQESLEQRKWMDAHLSVTKTSDMNTHSLTHSRTHSQLQEETKKQAIAHEILLAQSRQADLVGPPHSVKSTAQTEYDEIERCCLSDGKLNENVLELGRKAVEVLREDVFPNLDERTRIDLKIPDTQTKIEGLNVGGKKGILRNVKPILTEAKGVFDDGLKPDGVIHELWGLEDKKRAAEEEAAEFERLHPRPHTKKDDEAMEGLKQNVKDCKAKISTQKKKADYKKWDIAWKIIDGIHTKLHLETGRPAVITTV